MKENSPNNLGSLNQGYNTGHDLLRGRESNRWRESSNKVHSNVQLVPHGGLEVIFRFKAAESPLRSTPYL